MDDLGGFVGWLAGVVAVSAFAGFVAFEVSANPIVTFGAFVGTAWGAMHLLQRKFERDSAAARRTAPPGIQSIVLEFNLSNSEHGTAAERARLQQLAGSLSRAVEEAEIGDYDGDEFGGGLCRLFFNGPAADVLETTLQRALDQLEALQPIRIVHSQKP